MTGLLLQKLVSWPRYRDDCGSHGDYGCLGSPKVFHGASMAQRAADAELPEARSGIHEDGGPRQPR